MTARIVIEKVAAFVIRPRQGASAELLLFAHLDFDDVPIQIPGGSIEEKESPVVAARRELLEESGLKDLRLIRSLGIISVASESVPGATLRRHAYLLDGSGLPDAWTHIVVGEGEDQGLRFGYQWYDATATLPLKSDFRFFTSRHQIPELYELHQRTT